MQDFLFFYFFLFRYLLLWLLSLILMFVRLFIFWAQVSLLLAYRNVLYTIPIAGEL